MLNRGTENSGYRKNQNSKTIRIYRRTAGASYNSSFDEGTDIGDGREDKRGSGAFFSAAVNVATYNAHY